MRIGQTDFRQSTEVVTEPCEFLITKCICDYGFIYSGPVKLLNDSFKADSYAL